VPFQRRANLDGSQVPENAPAVRDTA